MFAARVWRSLPQRYRYEASKCKKCGQIYFPPRLICQECRSTEMETVILAQEGVILSHTVIRVPPAPLKDEAPYAIAIVKLDDGVKLTAQVVDCDPTNLKVGDRVKLEFRRVQTDGASGVIAYGYKFVPVW